MGLSLRGSTSGSIDINPPAVAGNNTITLPGDNGSANQFFRNSTIAGIVTYSSMVETASGKVGIGTDDPSEMLDIVGGDIQVSCATTTSTDWSIIRVKKAEGSGIVDFMDEGAGATTSDNPQYLVGRKWNERRDSLAIWRFTGGHQAADVLLQSSGDVYVRNKLGIGITNPNTNLEIALSGSSADGLLLSSDNIDTSARLFFQNATAGEGYAILQENGGLDFRSGATAGTSSGTQRVRIDSSGRLLVGTPTSPSLTDGQYAKIHLVGNTAGASGDAVLNLGRGILASSGMSAGTNLGILQFTDSAGAAHATIKGVTDAATGSNDYPGRLVFSTTADGGTSPTEHMRIDRAGNIIFASGSPLFHPWAYNNTSASAANTFIDSSGVFRRSTSSIKYKTNVETLQDQYADAILGCRPVWYQSTCNGDNPDWGWWGFIAEEVAEIDARLVFWKTTESVVQEDGTTEHVQCDPEPEGVQYDRFVPHLLNLIKRQKEQIEAMEARLTSLEGA